MMKILMFFLFAFILLLFTPRFVTGKQGHFLKSFSPAISTNWIIKMYETTFNTTVFHMKQCQ